MKNIIFSKCYEATILIKVVDIFNKISCFSLDKTNPVCKYFYGIRAFFIFLHFLELVDNILNFTFAFSEIHYIFSLISSLILQISCFNKRKFYFEISKSFKDLQNDFKIYAGSKGVACSYVFQLSYFTFIIFSVFHNTSLRIPFWKLDNFSAFIKILLFFISSNYCLLIQHYVILLFCNYLIILRMHLKQMKDNLKKSAKVEEIRFISRCESYENFG